MTDSNKFICVDNAAVGAKSNANYCFGCLSDSNEKQIHSYAFLCDPLKEIFKMQNIFLCYLCKRMAQHAELFVKAVQSNQMLLKNFCNENFQNVRTIINDEILKPQTQPLVKLKHVIFDVIELLEKDGDTCEESFSVVCNEREEFKDDIQMSLKLEIKEEEAELPENIEVELENSDEEFPERCVKEEDNVPLNAIIKEELDVLNIDNIDNNINLSPTIKKKVKKKGRINEKDDNESRTGINYIKPIYITRTQCMEERERMAQDSKYLELAYKCAECIKGFSFKGSYDKHMETHNQCKGDFVCDICRRRMDSEDKLVSHMRYHLIRYKCPECGIKRKCRMTIKDHYTAHHLAKDQQFFCPQCLKKYSRQVSLRRHIAYAHGSKERVQCAYCNRTYVSKTVLKSHMTMKHSKEVSAVEVKKKCVCPECGAKFKSPSQLRYHSVKHSNKRDYYCVECDKSFKSATILNNHLKMATIHVTYKELPFSCEHCNKRFSTRRDLDRHTNRVHLNHKPYKCDSCDKAYACTWALKEHKKNTHEGYKRPLQYPCPMCDKIFNRKQILKNHIRTHTGERPYKCDKCPAQFSQPSVLRSHDHLVHLKLSQDSKSKTAAIK